MRGPRQISSMTLALCSLLCAPALAAAADMAVNLDGVNDYLSSPGTVALKPAATMAVEAWIKPNGTDISGSMVVSLTDRYNLKVKTDSLMAFSIYTGSYKNVSANGGPVLNGAWHHVVGQKTSTGIELYVDGVWRGSTAVTNNIAYPATTELRIGKHGTTGTALDYKGAIDEVRIYNRALSAAEIAAHYNAGAGKYGTAESGLVGGWHFDEGASTSAADYSGSGHTATLRNGVTWVVGKVVQGGSPPDDTTAPSVSLTAPANGATVSGTIAVAATASDNAGVAGVQFKLDGANLGVEDTTAPYSTIWNTTTASEGAHALTAVARDPAGNSATATSISVTVDNVPSDTTPPTGSIIINGGAPVTNNATVTLTLSAADPSGVTQMCFSHTAASCTTSPIAYATSFSWTLSAGDGTKTVYVQFKDAVGNWSAAGAISDGITLDTTPPMITILDPIEGQVIVAPNM